MSIQTKRANKANACTKINFQNGQDGKIEIR